MVSISQELTLCTSVMKNLKLTMLNFIIDIERFLKEEFGGNNCTNTLIKWLCHYYLPPCGNSSHYEAPTSVCPGVCELYSNNCKVLLENVDQRLEKNTGNNLNCSISILDPIPHPCSNLGLHIPGMKICCKSGDRQASLALMQLLLIGILAANESV